MVTASRSVSRTDPRELRQLSSSETSFDAGLLHRDSVESIGTTSADLAMMMNGVRLHAWSI